MLRVGVTGGIGSGKSSVSRRLAELGAIVIDADEVAREVVEPGEPALAAIRTRFGDAVMRPDGSLDRAALAAIVFPDPDALAALDAITGPAIGDRIEQRRGGVPAGRVTVFDMPLLVERRLWVHEHLAVVVHVDVETRVRRLVEQRGLDEGDVRHRIAAQVDDAERRAAADVWLDNNGTPDELVAAVDALWRERIEPFNANLVSGMRTQRPDRNAVVSPEAAWCARGERVVARLAAALARAGATGDVTHIGSTAVPGLIAKDVIDIQIGVAALEDADRPEFGGALRDAGYVLSVGNLGDTPHPAGADPAGWAKRFYGGCDPAQIVHIHVREAGSPGWRFALLFRDWLRAVPQEREGYAAHKRALLAADPRTDVYAEAKEPWFEDAWRRAWAWADETGWAPSPGELVSPE
ncbi:MAG: dephospho-CoA kinase [Intrasporangium sp.]|uniref:dephospho-CoA kinase n=1 Tax=Intrasporangium sp. TaxID=1925024 RepID=UPI003F7D8691